MNLDDHAALALDADGMLAHISRLGHEMWDAWLLTERLQAPAPASDLTAVVLAGVGGSATAGDYVAALAAESSPVPVVVCRGYSLPEFVGKRTLVVVSSYSGNTEETLSVYEDAIRRHAPMLCITSGGKLAERAQTDGVPVYRVGYRSAPRAALGHGLAPLLRLLSRLELIPVDDDMVKAAGQAHARLASTQLAAVHSSQNNGAKRAASLIHGRIPFVIGTQSLAAVATRFRNQLAENGKSLGASDMIPEAAHNLVVGLGTAHAVVDSVALVTLEARNSTDVRTLAQMDGLVGQFEEAGVPLWRVDVGGDSLLEQLMVGTAWADFTSYYVALLNRLDPTPIPQIERLKPPTVIL